MKVSIDTNGPPPVARPQREPCPLCGAELRFSHRQYAGAGRSVAVLRCLGCGGVVQGAARQDHDRPPARPRRQRPLPEGGQPDNFVLDPATADRLLRSLQGEEEAAE